MGMSKVVWSLFDGSGLAAQPWAEAGYDVFCFNWDDADHGPYGNLGCKVVHEKIHYVNLFIDGTFLQRCGPYGVPSFIMAFPPCTDLAVSGAAHFARKREINPDFQNIAVRTAKVAYKVAKKFGVPYMIENPVSVLSTMWRAPNYRFHPWEYGGYLPLDDSHPFFPDYIAARDAYPKLTCLWTGGGFIMPHKITVRCTPGYSSQHSKLGGKGVRTKTIRSLTPRGFALAIYKANKVKVL